jgi:hypothetical protein
VLWLAPVEAIVFGDKTGARPIAGDGDGRRGGDPVP